VVLKDKREIVLDDENDFSLSFISGGKMSFTFPIDYPSGGYGGGSLLLSPSERYLLFSYYSGQCEEAFMLFQINDDVSERMLGLVYETGYLYGEVASYGFSQNEKLLMQGLSNSCTLWDWDYIEEGFVEKDENGDPFFDFGHINILDTVKKELEIHQIRIYFPEDTKIFTEEYTPLMLPKMINENTLTITMPWGEEALSFPLDKTIIFSF
jgi:hypothetical protein